MGRFLIVIGLLFLVAGIVVSLLPKTGIPLGRLPGDFVWRGKNTTVYFPFVTCLLLSGLLTLVLWLFGRR